MVDHEVDGHAALVDGGHDALQRAVADVAGDKHAGDVCLQWEGRALQRPRPLLAGEVDAREHESVLVRLHEVSEPIGRGCRTDEDEEAADVHVLRFTAVVVPQIQTLEMVIAERLDDLGARVDLDVVRSLDAVDEVGAMLTDSASARQIIVTLAAYCAK